MNMLRPVIHGGVLVRRVRERRPGLAVVLLTGQAGSEDGVEGLRSGARACLAKPLDLGELLVLFGQLQEEKADA